MDIAKFLLEAAEKKAKEMGLAENIAIVDDGANLVAFHRMDHAKIGGIDISQNKAWTSVALQMPTSNLSEAAQPGHPSFGINTTNHGRVVILGGGIPLKVGDTIIGGIGVSGGTSQQDIEVANAAIQALERLIQHNQARYLSYQTGSNQS
nr:heme-binding protein [Paenibacillus dendrobii]